MNDPVTGQEFVYILSVISLDDLVDVRQYCDWYIVIYFCLAPFFMKQQTTMTITNFNLSG